ncbi:MAG: L-histidine N(alpha)-methyltransferase [Alphaproteobacteria bacterium]
MTDFSGRIVTASPFATSVLAGLAAAPKTLEPKYFYDEVGSKLFDRICELPEYYVTRAEIAILEAIGPELAAKIGRGALLFEPGAGSTQKIRILLDALRPRVFVPADISAEHLHAAASELAADYPDVDIHPIAIDFTRDFALPDAMSREGAVTVFFPGSTIGNLAPGPAVELLDRLGRDTGADWLVIGVDLKKDERILVPAYDDAEGVTAAFNLNILARINRELEGSFDLDAFRHEARWNESLSRIEMHLVSTKAQAVEVLGGRFDFAEGETIHTENSHKYTVEAFHALAAKAGWTPEQVWTGEANLFSVHLMRRA